jgi:RNA polymerase sigma factor (TIGR02999 family)
VLSDVTRILDSIQHGDPKAADELLPLVYAELHKLAAYKMAHLAAGHTLQPTALVHEVWLRLVGSDNPTFENRAHFFAAAAEAMRHFLIDNARRKLARRHGGGLQRVDVENVDLAMPADEDHLLAVNEALERLATRSPIDAEVVKLRFFVGMTVEESAEVLAWPNAPSGSNGLTPRSGSTGKYRPRRFKVQISGGCQSAEASAKAEAPGSPDFVTHRLRP